MQSVRNLTGSTLFRLGASVGSPLTSITRFVCAILSSNTRACLLRSYENSRVPELLYDSCKIWEACRATSAATRFFDPIAIGPYKQQFIDGALKNNNPIQMVYREANLLWPGRIEDTVFISIGTGRAPSPVLEGNVVDVVQALTNIALETESTADDFCTDHGSMSDRGLLYRFNVSHGLADVGLDEYKENRRIADATHAYMSKQETRQQWTRCLAKLSEGSHSGFVLLPSHDQLMQPMSQFSLSEVSETQRAPRLDRSAQDSLTTGTDSQIQAHEASNEVFSGSSASMQKFTKVMYAAINFEDFRTLISSLEEGADINAENGRPLREAADVGSLEMIKLLIRKGAIVDSRDKEGKTALHVATVQRHVAAIEVLLEHGADANAVDKSGLTALYYAPGSDHGGAAMARLLLDYGANAEAIAEEHRGSVRGVLQLAACTGDTQLVKTLLDGGAIVNRRDWTGLSALHFAVVNGHYPTAKMLLEFGAEPGSQEWDSYIERRLS